MGPEFLWAGEQVVKSKLHGKLIAYNIHAYHGIISRIAAKNSRGDKGPEKVSGLAASHNAHKIIMISEFPRVSCQTVEEACEKCHAAHGGKYER